MLGCCKVFSSLTAWRKVVVLGFMLWYPLPGGISQTSLSVDVLNGGGRDLVDPFSCPQCLLNGLTDQIVTQLFRTLSTVSQEDRVGSIL